MQVAVDSSVLVGLINPSDLWRDQALALRDAVLTTGAELLYFDCVVTESISAAARRLQEKGRSAEVTALFDRLDAQVPRDTITWILPDVPHLYPEALDLMRSSSGALNLNMHSSPWHAGSEESRPSPALTPTLTRSPGCAAWHDQRMWHREGEPAPLEPLNPLTDAESAETQSPPPVNDHRKWQSSK